MEPATIICPMLLLRPGIFLFRQLQLEPSASFLLFSLTVTVSRNLHRYYLKIKKSLHKIQVSNWHLGFSNVLQSIQDKRLSSI